MKSIIIPLVEQDNHGCDCTVSAHRFDAEWCLDLHGYLNREEFAARLREINNYIKNYPLLSTRQKKYLTYAVAGVALFVLFIVLLLRFAATEEPSSPTTTLIIYSFLGLALPIGRKIIDQMAKNRAILFSQALQPVLDQFNRKENPTANWKLVWRVVFTHFSIKIDSNGKGTATPKYAEYAELVIEINDALSDLTAQTVRINLAPTTVSMVSTTAPMIFTTVPRVSNIKTTYPPQMVAVP
ncbi:1506_t:CDS:1 [Paraglomus brasilianum]|uniref:1506_t:CDS:1 n=1 Tax=Paraglomus brasilianum TaxID=144538 RepID=A0A9N9A607_9GLOM|nr:1506_t:CDS:1 [Paraglomus brasilianum]